ncbi:HEXXH motif domain-containing protein [Dactylosporangium sp. CA-139066]|uniref:HEXXH motif domain-containing protein n=1 Tax=Dactylosporangium sp. CA-139066 TaxID=3239930 RepID=UPI003D8D7892
MSNERMLLSAEQFSGVAAGYGDAGAMAVLAAGQLAKRRTLITMVVHAVRGTPFAAPVVAAAQLIARAEAAGGPAVAEVLSHPHLDAWANAALHRLTDYAETGDAPGVPEVLGHLASYAGAAAIAAGLPFAVEVPTVDGVAGLPGLGTAHGLGAGWARVDGDGSAVRVTGAGGTVVELGGPGWQPRRTVALGGFRLAIEDQDPYRHCYNWRPLPALSESRAGHLAKLLADAWQLIEQDHPAHAVGLRHSLRSLVPLATPDTGVMISAASRRACGSIAVSIPDSAADLALLLIHEYMHAKLGALLDLCELHTPAGPARLQAPWRLDPRPAGALLQGIYAHTGVTDYWRRRRHSPDADTRRAAAQFAYWRAMNRIAIEDLINSGEMTPLGDHFARVLRATLERWETEDIPSDIVARTQLFVTAQTVRWLLLNAHADALETERLFNSLRFGTPVGTIAERGMIDGGAPAAPADAPGLLAELHRWLDGHTEPVRPSGPDPLTTGAMLLADDAEGAQRAALARLDADARDDEAWIALAVARGLQAPPATRSDPTEALVHRLLLTRPELLREAVSKLQSTGHPRAASELLKLESAQVGNG